MDENEKISLNEFLSIQKKRLERFRKEWLDGLRDEPKQYPWKLPPGEWTEQLRAFENMEE